MRKLKWKRGIGRKPGRLNPNYAKPSALVAYYIRAKSPGNSASSQRAHSDNDSRSQHSPKSLDCHGNRSIKPAQEEA
jgi:hypothetical protein